MTLNYAYRRARQAIGAFVLCAVAAAFTACRHDEEEAAVPAPAYEDRYIPLELCIPASAAIVRSPGDPGADPRLPLPDYLYLFTVVQTGGSEVVLRSVLEDIGDQWEYDGQETGAVFRYNGSINIPLIANAQGAACYIVASGEPLVFTPAEPSTGQEVKDLQLDLGKGSDNEDVQLRDVYSSWHSVKVPDGGLTVEDYGSNQSSVEGTLYHVGAKVDLQWNVTEACRQAHPGWGVQAVDVHSPAMGYVFRPTKNADDDSDGRRSYQCPTNTGNAYYGRTDCYVWQRASGRVDWEIDFAEGIIDGGGTDHAEVQGSSTPTNAELGQVAYYRLTFTINGITQGTVDTGNGE